MSIKNCNTHSALFSEGSGSGTTTSEPLTVVECGNVEMANSDLSVSPLSLSPSRTVAARRPIPVVDLVSSNTKLHDIFVFMSAQFFDFYWPYPGNPPRGAYTVPGWPGWFFQSSKARQEMADEKAKSRLRLSELLCSPEPSSSSDLPRYLFGMSTDDPIDVPPAARLVCVEENPGPPKKTKKIKTVVIQVKNPKKGNGKGVRIRGKGDYSLLGKVGGFVGDAAQNAIMKIMGVGDYTVQQNTLLGGASPPKFSGAKDREVVVRHREFIMDVYSAPYSGPATSSPFDLRTFNINPANEALFPWLNSVAQNFEQYKLNGCIFEFKSMSANALTSTNTALGTVIMATQYNSLDAPFVDKRQMEQYDFVTSTVPSCSAIHPVECASAQSVLTDLYILNDGVKIGDPRFSDMGNFNIATVGMQSPIPVNLGELWISYDITFKKPRLSSPYGEIRGLSQILGSQPSGVGPSFQLNAVNSIANGTVPVQTSRVSVGLDNSHFGSDPNIPRYLPDVQAPGYYMLDIMYNVGGSPGVPTINAGGGVSLVAYWYGSTLGSGVSFLVSDAAGAGNFPTLVEHINICFYVAPDSVQDAAFLTFQFPIASSAQYGQITVTQIPPFTNLLTIQ